MHCFCVHKADTRPPKPKTKVKNAFKAKRLDALTRRMQNAIAADLFNGIRSFKKKVSRAALERAWNSGNYDSIDRFIPWQDLDTSLAKAKKRMNESLFDSTGLAFGQLPAPVRAALRWDLANPAIRDYINKKIARLVQDITHETRVQVREMVTRSFERALTPREAAEEIQGSIGLHKRYREALRNYRRGLMEKGIAGNKLSNLLDRRENELLKSRAMTVARTETRQAVNHGQRTVWREAARQGLIDKQEAKRVWVIDGEGVCDICEPMDGVETTIDEPFISPTIGPTEPGEAHPNCACVEVLELD